MDEAVKLDVLICTHGAKGLDSVAAMQLPRVAGVRYIVSCQDPDGAARSGKVAESHADTFCRDDVELHFSETRGLSANRNIALDLARAPYVLIADDDLRYTPEGLLKVIRKFDSDPELDVATFRYGGPERKVYPDEVHDLSTPYRYYHVTSFEIALRRESAQRVGLRFSLLAGLGAPYLHSGEENLLIHNAMRKGLKGRFFPETIVMHPDFTTTVTRGTDPGVVRARGAMITVMRGLPTAVTRFPIEAWRTRLPFFLALLYLVEGCIYSIVHRKEL